MPVTLYQFPISHYCEKVRWALDLKAVDYRCVNLLPGLHLSRTSKMAPRTSVPIIQSGDTIIQGSAQILTWLDEQYPHYPLTPAPVALRDAALALEAELDRDVGVHLRRFAYHTLLDHPGVVKPFFLKDGPLWWRPFLAITYPKLSGVMRKVMKIDAAGAAESERVLQAALDRLAEAYSRSPYLVGEAFSRADLAAAALMAPMVMPEAYGLDWPASMPEPLQGWVDGNAGKLDWVRRLYREYR